MSDPTSRPAIAAKRDNMDEYDIIFVGLSLRHLLLNLVWHVDQAKSVEQPIDIRHTPDISQSLRSVHYLSNFTDIRSRFLRVSLLMVMPSIAKVPYTLRRLLWCWSGVVLTLMICLPLIHIILHQVYLAGALMSIYNRCQT